MGHTPLTSVRLAVTTVILLAGSNQPSAVAAEPQEGASRATRLTVATWDGHVPAPMVGSSMFVDWREAARNFDFGRATDDALPEDARAFLSALALIVADRLTDAEAILESLTHRTSDDAILADAAQVLAILYQQAGDNEGLLTLVQRYPALVSSGVVEGSDVVLARAALTANRPEMAIELPNGATTLPLSFAVTGTPMLEVEVNGTKEHFWLDTGSSGTLVASNVADRMGVQLVGDPFEVDNLGTTLPLQGGFIETLGVGPITVRNLEVAVLDESILTIGSYRIAGIIGWPILRELRMEFDYGEEIVTIDRSEERGSSERNFFWFDYPFVQLHTPEGVPLHFGLDTGADVTRIKPNIFKKLANAAPEEITAAVAALGGGTIEQQVWMLNQASFFVREARLDFMNIKTTDGVSARFVAPDGRLGADVFRDAVVVLDFRAGEFRIVVK